MVVSKYTRGFIPGSYRNRDGVATALGALLCNLTELTGMDRSALSKLETGQGTNPTVGPLVRYAEAVGKVNC